MPLAILASIFGFFGLRFLFHKIRPPAPRAASTTKRRSTGDYDVMTIQLGISSKGAVIREHLEKLARETDMSQFEPRANALRTIGIELKRQKDELLFGSTDLSEQMTAQAAEQHFMSLAGAARSKFTRETIRGDATGVREQEKNIALKDQLLDEDGDFLVQEVVVLTLVMATAKDVPFVPNQLLDSTSIETLIGLLQSMPTKSLIALEVVWSPSADSDAMSFDEMSMSYPEMIRI